MKPAGDDSNGGTFHHSVFPIYHSHNNYPFVYGIFPANYKRPVHYTGYQGIFGGKRTFSCHSHKLYGALMYLLREWPMMLNLLEPALIIVVLTLSCKHTPFSRTLEVFSFTTLASMRPRHVTSTTPRPTSQSSPKAMAIPRSRHQRPPKAAKAKTTEPSAPTASRHQ